MQAVSKPAALMRAAQAIVDRRARLAASPPAGPKPKPSSEASRAPEPGARSFQGVEGQPGQLLGSIDTLTVPKADGSGHEVRHVDTGRVIAEGASAREANAAAQDLARNKGRRRLLAWLLPDESKPPAWTQNPDLFALYDGTMRQGSAWQTAHHNGQAIDPGIAQQRYNALQEQISAAITNPNTPDEARLPLATAGEQLFTAGNVAGFVDAGKLPYSMLYAGTGVTAFGGGDSATGPHITPRRTSNVLPRRVGIYKPYQGSYPEPEQIGPRSPQSPLAEGVGYPDPDPRFYEGDITPDTPVKDHIRARALGGHPTESVNINPKRALEENARKGAYEGQIKADREQLIRDGLTPEQADWVLEEEQRWIETDIHARPVDPATLKDLPSP